MSVATPSNLSRITPRLEVMTDAEASRMVWYLYGQAITMTTERATMEAERFEQAVNACLFTPPSSRS